MMQRDTPSVVEKFLIENGLHHSCYDFEAHTADFISEMNAGLAGAGSSLLMLKSYLGVIPGKLPSGDVIAIDAGGTNLRVALVRFAPDSPPVLVQYDKYRLPGSEGEIDKDEFFSRISDYIGDLTDISDKIGFCFSFPCEIAANHDGKILTFDKEVRVKGSSGAYIGMELNIALARAGKGSGTVTVLNDTVAALLGEVFAGSLYGMGGYIGMIHGTGFNIAYHDAGLDMIVNTEAGGYGGFRQTECDLGIDAESEDPGRQRFEKMVSGAYFAKVALKVMHMAAEQGLFSRQAAETIKNVTHIDAGGIDSFMRERDEAGTLSIACPGLPDSAPMENDDADILYGIFNGLYERTAKLAAITMAAVMTKAGASEEKPALIIAEGSFFRKGYKFQERFETWLRQTNARGTERDARSYKLVLADDHVTIGAAAAVFL